MQLSWIIVALLASPALMGCASGGADTSSPARSASTAPPQPAAEAPKTSTQSDAEPIALVPIAQAWHRAPSPGRQTQLALPRDKSVALSGSWRERDTLWDDAALVYAADGHELCVLDGGASAPRHIWTHPEERGALLCSPAWSADGTALYLWMNLDLGLCALDAHTAKIRPLATLDSHVWHYEGMKHFDPQPRFRETGVLEDAARRRLFLLLDEESNAEVAFWQRHDGRGGSWLVTVDPEGGPLEPLFTKSAMRETVVGWDLSPKRGRLYALALPLEITAYVPARPRRLEERRLNGSIVRVFAEPDGKAATIQLSPDQRRLLIERSYRPGFAIPPGDIDDMSREQVRSLVDNDYGGWVVLDLETGECLDGPERGQESRWAPDSDRIVTVDDWAITVRSLHDLTITPLIEGGAEDWGLGTWIEPVWSPDGRRLAITGRVLDTTLLLDLERREYFVVHQHVSEKIWAPVPRPFDQGPGAARLGQWVAPVTQPVCSRAVRSGAPLAVLAAACSQWLVRWNLAGQWSTYSRWRWRLAPEERREDMAHDFVAQHAGADLDAVEILRELGLPDSTSDRDQGIDNESIYYAVGGSQRASHEARKLVVTFDRTGHVMAMKVR